MITASRRLVAISSVLGLAAAVGACGGSNVDRELAAGLDATPPVSTPALETTVVAPTSVVAATTEVSSPEPTTATTTLPALTPENAPRISWGGEAPYLHGANLPWINFGCDFGCGASGGVSSEEVRRAASERFAEARDAGMNVVRWWVLPGEPRHFELDEQGLPNGLRPEVFADLDAAAALAEEYGLQLILTLFSAPSHLPESWITTLAGRQKLTAALVPLFVRFADVPAVMTWQPFNEPEWDFWISERHVEPEPVIELVRMIADEVHENSPTLVSIGTARLDGLSFWRDAPLDYFTVHWYDPMTEPQQCAPCTTVADISSALGVSRPVLIGEFYLGTDVPADDRLWNWHDRGYAGALAWSLNPDATGDGLAIDLDAARRFADGLLELQ